MPLLKKSAEAPTQLPPNKVETITTEAPKESACKRESAMTKDDYWRRREERDLATQVHIRRSGLFQAALQSVGILQLNTGNTLEDYLKLVEAAAERGLQFVQKA